MIVLRSEIDWLPKQLKREILIESIVHLKNVMCVFQDLGLINEYQYLHLVVKSFRHWPNTERN